MAYTPFNSTEVLPSKPNKTELWTKVKDNFDDHEGRLTSLESTGLNAFPIQFQVKGAHYLYGSLTGLATVRVVQNITLTSATLVIIDDGSSGTLEVDVQRKPPIGSHATIFSTRPSIVAGSGSHTVSTNAVLSVTSLSTGDFLRLDTVSVMTGCDEFYVQLTYEFT